MENMEKNFNLLNQRLFNAISNTDLDKIRYELKMVKHPTLISGVGGSSIVSDFACKVLSETNKIITKKVEPRDFRYMNLNGFKNVIACSYSGNNYGVELAFDNELKHYLLSGNKSSDKSVIPLYYELNNDKEKSFISLSSTLIPCTILFEYYLHENNLDMAKEMIINNYYEEDEINFNFDTNCDCYEIFSGYETSTAANFLESTLVESGIGAPIVHDKYSYCHGRSTLSINKNNIAIYFNGNTELDKLMLEELPKYYKDVIIIDPFLTFPPHNPIYFDFLLLNKCIYLTKYIAESKNKDLSKVEYSPITKKLYKYSGNI